MKKLVFEVVGILGYAIIFGVSVHQNAVANESNPADVIGYCIGYVFGSVVAWLAVEFIRRIWRILRRHEVTAVTTV